MRLIEALSLLLLLAAGTATASDDIFRRDDSGGAVVLSNLPDGEGFELLLAAPAGPAAPAPALAVAASGVAEPAASGNPRGASLPARVAEYRQAVELAARGAQVDARLVHAVIAVESGYNPNAISPKGALGLMQVMPETARRYGISDLRDPAKNLEAGARYLGDLLRLFKNDVKLALAAYNAGENAVLRHGGRIPPFRETIAYVPRVLAAYRMIETLLI